MDELQEKITKEGPIPSQGGLELPSPTVEDVSARMDEYEKKIEQLSTLLNEEEAHHRELATQLEGKVAELEKAMGNAGGEQ